MSEEQKQINNLMYALGLAIGALELIYINPHSFNREGLEMVLKKLTALTPPTFTIKSEHDL